MNDILQNTQALTSVTVQSFVNKGEIKIYVQFWTWMGYGQIHLIL